MLKSLKERNILKQGLLIVGAMAAFYLFFLSPFLKEGSNILDEELDRKTRDLKKYIAQTGSLPSRESFDKFEKEKNTLKDKYLELVEFIDPKKARIPEASSEAGLYFIERLHSTMKKFEEKKAASSLPDNLGFGDGLPKKETVETLMRQLETTEFVVERLLEKEGVEFITLKPLRSIDYLGLFDKKMIYTELPVQISARIDTDTLIDLLVELKNRNPVISVKELHVKSDGLGSSRDLEVSMVLSSFMIARTKE